MKRNDAMLPPDKAMAAKMLEVQTFINQNFASHFTIGELAKRFAINTTSLKTNFHAATGMGLYSYLRSRRMLKADQLLRVTGLSIAEIASRVGYRSAGSFIRAYKKINGVTPARKRRL